MEKIKQKVAISCCLVMAVFLNARCAGPICRLNAGQMVSFSSTGEKQLSVLRTEELPTSVWSQLLLRGEQYTCSGQVNRCEKHKEFTTRKFEHIVAPHAAGPDRHLVWLITHGGSGGLSGPVALVERDRRGLKVYAMDLLTLPRGKIVLEYQYGNHIESLWAKSRQCTKSKPLERKLCKESLVVLGRVGSKFVASSPILTLHEKAKSLGAGWYRVSEIKSSVTQYDNKIVVAEITEEHERLGQRPGMSARQSRLLKRNFERKFP